MTELVLQSMLELCKQRLSWRSVWTLLVAIFDPEQLGAVLSAAAQALIGTLPSVAIAVVLVAGLKATGAEALVAKAFEGRESRMIVLAAVLGGLTPFCSCEVIPFIAGFLALGAPLSVVMAFWLSSFSDPLRSREAGGCCTSATSGFNGQPVWEFWREPQRLRVFAKEGVRNGIFLIKWLSLAYLLEGLLVTYVPVYLNGYAALALVAAFIEQGMSVGVAMAFLVAGAVSCIPAMAAVCSLVKVFVSYLLFGIMGAMLSGFLFAALV